MTKNGRNGTPTPKERLWAAHFVTDPDRNATEAARQAGYKQPRVMGQRVSQRPRVKAVVAHLEAEARKRLRIKRPKPTTVEVLPPGTPLPDAKTVAIGLPPGLPVKLPLVAAEVAEEGAMATRAEALAVATNIIRTHESRKVKDLWNTTEDGKVKNMLMDPDKLGELPLSVIKGLKHDAAGDLELKLADPLVASRVILEDARRAREGEGAADLAAAFLEVLRGTIKGRVHEQLPEG